MAPSSPPRGWQRDMYLIVLSIKVDVYFHTFIHVRMVYKAGGVQQNVWYFFYNNRHQVSSTFFELFVIWATISKIYQSEIGYALKHLRYSSSSLTGVFWKKKIESAVSFHQTNFRDGGRSQNLGGGGQLVIQGFLIERVCFWLVQYIF